MSNYYQQQPYDPRLVYHRPQQQQQPPPPTPSPIYQPHSFAPHPYHPPQPVPHHHHQQQQQQPYHRFSSQPYPQHSFPHQQHYPPQHHVQQHLYNQPQPHPQLHRVPSSHFVPPPQINYGQPTQHFPPPQPQQQYQPPHPQSSFHRPLPLPAPKRADTVPPPQQHQRGAALARAPTAQARWPTNGTAPTRAPSTIPSSSFPSFPATPVPTSFSSFSAIPRSSSPTRRPLPSPAPAPLSKHYSLDLTARPIFNTTHPDQQDSVGRSRSESPIKRSESPLKRDSSSPPKRAPSSQKSSDTVPSSPNPSLNSRSESSTRSASAVSPASSRDTNPGPTATKFVPMWKRSLNDINTTVTLSSQPPSPSKAAESATGVGKRALPLSPDGTVGVIPDIRGRSTSSVVRGRPSSPVKFESSVPDRSPSPTKDKHAHSSSPTKRELPTAPNGRGSGSGRPLPSAPPRFNASDEADSESESESEPNSEDASSRSDGEAEPTSPQFGILDLPRRNVGVSDTERQTGGSMTLRFAALGLENYSTPTQQSSTKAKTNSQTPSRIPTSPVKSGNVRAGKRTGGHDYLDDAPPPPSLPRPPSSTSQHSQQAGSRGTDGDGVQHRRQPPPRWQPSTAVEPPPVEILHPVPEQPPKSRSGPSSIFNSNHDVKKKSNNGNDNEGPARPQIHIESPSPVGGRNTRADIPRLEFPDAEESGSEGEGSGVPVINIQGPPTISVDGPPTINVSGPVPEISISVSGADSPPKKQRDLPPPPVRRGNGLVCGGCGAAIIGRIVSAMGVRWHPACFKCTVCNELLEHVSSYEHEGRPYCHLDYHESFAPRCYSCKTAIIDERFITLDDPALGKRTYHEQHFFCAECGDPFLAPSSSSGALTTGRTGELSVTGDGVFEDDDVGFTVYNGHPYCEACHVRLRLPKCKKCKKSIRDGMQAVEALGGKWCWGCFVCEGCEKPFEEPSFFQREGLPFCERCFTIILKNEM